MLSGNDLDFHVLRNGWTLGERLQEAAGKSGLTGDPQAQRRLRSWREAIAPTSKADFEKRLAWQQLSTAEVAWALNPPFHDVPQSPEWFTTLRCLRTVLREAVASQQHDAGWLDSFTGRYSTLLNPHTHRPCEEVWYPLLPYAWVILTDSRNDKDQLTARARNALLTQLLQDLTRICTDPMATMFSEGRGVGEALLVAIREIRQGLETGGTRRYSEFVFGEVSRGLMTALNQYPVLGRLIATVFLNWLYAQRIFLSRLTESRLVIEESFGISSAEPVIDLFLGKGDPHRGGQSVSVAVFQGEKKLVYKPKCLEIEQKFHSLVHLCASGLGKNKLSSLCIVTRSDHSGPYGWSEYIEYAPANGENELRAFYRNAGQLLAILYLVGATDCHSENLVASGDQLTLVDAETILESQVSSESKVSVDGHITDRLEESVLRVGMLPQWMFNPATNTSYDVSALGAKPAALQSLQLPGWSMTRSDAMFRGVINVLGEHPQSSPVPQGGVSRLGLYSEALLSGFEGMLEWISRPTSKRSVAKALDTFAGVRRRFVYRPTKVYGGIRAGSLKPEVLQDRLLHDFQVEQLSRAALLSPQKGRAWELFELERSAMERLDIPIFEHELGTKTLPLAQGEVLRDFFTEDGITCAKRRIDGLNQQEIKWQFALADAALRCRQISMAGKFVSPNVADSTAIFAGQRSVGELVKHSEALSIAENLVDGSVGQGATPDWLGLQLMPDGLRFRLGLINPSIYDGKVGIALFLAYASKFAKHQVRFKLESSTEQILAGVMAPLRGDEQQVKHRVIRDLGLGFNGFSGLLLALLQIDVLFPEQAEFSKYIERLIDLFDPADIGTDTHFDLMHGASGAIGPLLRVFHRSGDERGLSLAKACGDHVLFHQQADTGGWLQGTNTIGRPLTGLSHGASGVAVALARLARATSDERYLAAAERGTLYESRQFDQSEGNWPDYRAWHPSSQRSFMSTWCHGAPGIALSRCLLLHISPDSGPVERWRNEFRQALDHTLKAEPLAHDHLCCGELGIAGTLMTIAKATGDPDIKAAARRRSEWVLRQRESSGHWRLLSPPEGGLYLPSLFTGLAGIGYHLLRECNPELVEDLFATGLLEP